MSDKGQKGWIPLPVAQIEPGEIPLAVGGIDGDQPAAVELGGKDVAFAVRRAIAVVLQAERLDDVIGEAADHVHRLGASEDGGAAVAGLVGGVPVFEIVGQIRFGLTLLCLGLLEAKDVRLMGLHKLPEGTLPDHRPNAIDVP